MFNKAILMGRICNDLELKSTQSGVSVLSFRIAVERSYQAQGEERKTDFFNIVAWRSTAEFISKYFSKGRMILVEGELQTRQYHDKNGVTQNIVELVVSSANFTGEKKEQVQQAQQTAHPAANSSGQAVQNDFTETTVDDDYPF
ncbi:MAG: single-stranded DNA-binding protein [Ruminiclostridium sp.]|nr:single-stranded DNA-binding protein [Ruminiclostridium sp.]